MRLRNVKGSNNTIEANKNVVLEPEKQKGKWSEVFGDDNPIEIEIGMGKGKFITTLAQKNPNINYVGIEKFSSVLVRAVEKIQDIEINNLKLILMNAENITDVFAENEVSKIYLNFSDPWPKDRHAKRRLTSSVFLAKYNQVLKAEGTVEFKTDNRTLFNFSLEEIPHSGWKIKNHTFDLHHENSLNEGNVMTEYEEKFSKAGTPINKLIAFR
ncbi:MAG: tRNA (guanosine(46)-N7)-methyltransferase TrmB [Lachnotalea sp.]